MQGNAFRGRTFPVRLDLINTPTDTHTEADRTKTQLSIKVTGTTGHQEPKNQSKEKYPHITLGSIHIEF